MCVVSAFLLLLHFGLLLLLTRFGRKGERPESAGSVEEKGEKNGLKGDIYDRSEWASKEENKEEGAFRKHAFTWQQSSVVCVLPT